jgi:transcriptional regulator with XRE-family HTH domain
MNNQNHSQKPFANLGVKLRQLREKNNESLVDVSGAVEIDSDQLKQFESGQARPSEDILLLLISHFNAKDELASSLWRLAGYSEPTDSVDKNPSEQMSIRHDVVIMAVDPRIIYSDKVQITANNYGVVLNFMQPVQANMPAMPISRIGMSKDHAYSLLQVLKNTLEQSDVQSKNLQKKLQSPRSGTDETSKK